MRQYHHLLCKAATTNKRNLLRQRHGASTSRLVVLVNCWKSTGCFRLIFNWSSHNVYMHWSLNKPWDSWYPIGNPGRKGGHRQTFLADIGLIPDIKIPFYCWQGSTTYHSEGLAIRLGRGKLLPLLAVSRLGSRSSMSSTSSCSSTSWSRMHLTEYWPNTPSCAAGEQKQKIIRIKVGLKSSLSALASPAVYAPAPGPAYELQPPDGRDSISKEPRPVSTAVHPVEQTQEAVVNKQ